MIHHVRFEGVTTGFPNLNFPREYYMSKIAPFEETPYYVWVSFLFCLRNRCVY